MDFGGFFMTEKEEFSQPRQLLDRAPVVVSQSSYSILPLSLDVHESEWYVVR